MTPLALARELGHEEGVLVQNASAGLRAVIAIHDTTLGPAVGGTRMRLYPSLDEACRDALRLARAMTYKAALAGVPRGGGKAVILADPARDKTRVLLTAYASLVNSLGGRFFTGADMGIDGRDVAVLARLTKYASHAPKNLARTTWPSVTGAVRRNSIVPVRFSSLNVRMVNRGATMRMANQKKKVPPKKNCA